MSYLCWTVPKADLDAKAGQEEGGFDADGIHSCCRHFGNYANCRVTPVASLEIGPVLTVLIRCDKGVDLSVHYPNITLISRKETLDITRDPTKHWFDPEPEA